jgi:hypothetical protein
VAAPEGWADAVRPWWWRQCRCGHFTDLHRHYRAGSGCAGECGPDPCPCRRFRRAWLGRVDAEDGPRGARLRHRDGSVTECSLIREPGRRRRWWAEVPPGTVFGREDVFEVDYLPGYTELNWRLPLDPAALDPEADGL